MVADIFDVDPREWLSATCPNPAAAATPRPPGKALLRTVTFAAPVRVQIIGEEPAVPFYLDPTGLLFWLPNCKADEFEHGVPAFLARQWPGVTFLAPVQPGGPPVALVDCRGPQEPPPPHGLRRTDIEPGFAPGDLDAILNAPDPFTLAGDGDDVSEFTGATGGIEVTIAHARPEDDL